jgi:hypothetical protein
MYNDNNDNMPATMAVQLIGVIIDSKDNIMKPNFVCKAIGWCPPRKSRGRVPCVKS